MHPPPSRLELLDIVAEFLRKDLLPRLDGATAFHTRVAANVLDIVRRELALTPDAEEAERRRLEHLLGMTGTVEVLNDALCLAIREDRIGPDTPGLWDHLWATTLDTLAVDQPGYAAYRLETARTPINPQEGSA